MNWTKNFCLIICAFQVAAELSTVKDVLFIIRTKQQLEGDDNVLKFKDMKSLEASGIDPRKPTIIQIHGIAEDFLCQHHLQLSEALLEATDRNLIFVDWVHSTYGNARRSVEILGKVIAEQLDFMNEKIGLNISSVTIIGFNLGAHIAGIAGKNVNNGKIGMIVGLDPAEVFDFNKPSTRLDGSDGAYVIAVHTGVRKGINKSLAQADFFINTGENQPGCQKGEKDGVCSYNRAVLYYTEAVKNPDSFWGIRCTSESQALTGKCSDGPNASLGDPKFAKGIFSIRTNKESPFGTGRTE